VKFKELLIFVLFVFIDFMVLFICIINFVLLIKECKTERLKSTQTLQEVFLDS